MVRRLRIQNLEAFYYVACRGDEQWEIFLGDYQYRFLKAFVDDTCYQTFKFAHAD